jgi:hypothetical protein
MRRPIAAHRGRALASVLLVAATACTSATVDGRTAGPVTTSPAAAPVAGGAATTAAGTTTTTVRGRAFSVPQAPASPPEPGPHALVPSDIPDVPTEIRFEDPAFGPPLVRSGDLRPGGPGPDGIPAIDRPMFLRVPDVDFLAPREPVFVLAIGDDVRAYPLQIMLWHEIVNDTVGGVPVAVTYCPLCNSALAHDRRHEGRVLTFGVSGALWNSALVMFDRQTFSLWSHFTGQGLLGRFASDELTSYPVSLASWSSFAEAYPTGLVLSRDTGWTRDYGRNPYPGYDDLDEPPFLFEGEVDGRYAAKTRVVGIDLPTGARAVTLDRLTRDRVVPLDSGDRPLVVWWRAGTTSALDAADVVDGRDVGTTGAFVAMIDERPLTFAASGDDFRDAETGSRWNVFGLALEGPLAGRRLDAIPHVDTFWFAWAAFRPTTAVAG